MPLENIREKKIFIKLDKEREIRFTFRALAELQEIYMDFNYAYRELCKGSIIALGAFLHVGLRHEEDLTVYRTAELLRLTTEEELADKIRQAIKADFPKIEDLNEAVYDDGFLPGDAPPEEIEEIKEEFINWEEHFHFACFVLYMPEEVFWNMTPRKFYYIARERKRFWRNSNGRN